MPPLIVILPRQNTRPTFYSIVSILAFTNDEGSGDRKPNYRRKQHKKKRKDLIIRMIKEMPEKNIQKCLQVFSVLYVERNILQMKKGYSI